MGEIIGLYLGKFKKEMDYVGDYGYQLGHIDAVQGLDGKAFMGMLFINDPCLGGKQKNIHPNAVGWDTCEVTATIIVNEGEEILLSHKGICKQHTIKDEYKCNQQFIIQKEEQKQNTSNSPTQYEGVSA